jgi:hypothetical protein
VSLKTAMDTRTHEDQVCYSSSCQVLMGQNELSNAAQWDFAEVGYFAIPIAASILFRDFSFPITSSTSKMPGLTVPPVKATRTG